MKEKKIQELLDNIFSKKFTKKYNHSDSSYSVFAVEEDARFMIEDIIRNFLKENREEALGTLEAKVFMYEQIIAKSNFGPMLKNAADESEL